MRTVDWVDRLAGISSLAPDRDLGDTMVAHPQGPWLTWPKWRRLLDLLLARTWWRLYAAVTFLPYARGLRGRRGDMYYPDFVDWMAIMRGTHDIHLAYRLEFTDGD